MRLCTKESGRLTHFDAFPGFPVYLGEIGKTPVLGSEDDF